MQSAGRFGERRTAKDVVAEHDHVVAILLRDHYCPRSRQLVTDLADSYESFAGRSTAVVPVLPDRPERAAVWQRRYDLPFELLADPTDDSTGDDEGFGAFGPFGRLIPALPGGVLFDATDGALRFERTVDRNTLAEESAVDVLLELIDDHREDGISQPVEPGVNAESFGGS